MQTSQAPGDQQADMLQPAGGIGSEDAENEPTAARPETQTARGCVERIDADQVTFGPGLAGVITAGQDCVVHQTIAGNIRAIQGAQIEQSLSAAMVAGAGLEIKDSLAQVMVAGENMDLDDSGALISVAGGNITVHGGLVGVAITDNLHLHDDSRVLLNTRQAILFGAAFGVLFGLVSHLLPRRRHR
jgi:hypothetical protein